MFHMKLIYNGECDFDSSYIECMKHATPKVKSNEKNEWACLQENTHARRL